MTHILFCNTAEFVGKHCECSNVLSGWGSV